jgi:hypothetical protein
MFRTPIKQNNTFTGRSDCCGEHHKFRDIGSRLIYRGRGIRSPMWQPRLTAQSYLDDYGRLVD